MELYAAFDLHANNNFFALIDQDGSRVFQKKLSNDRGLILEVLRPYRKQIRVSWLSQPTTGIGWSMP